MNDELTKKALLEGNYVSVEDMELAEAYASAHSTSFTEYLLNNELLNRDLIGQAIAESLGTTYFDLNSNPSSKETVTKIPQDIAVLNRIILIGEDANSAHVVSDVTEARDLALVLSGLFPNKKIVTQYSLSEDIDESLGLYREKLDTRFSQIISKENRVAPEIVEQIIVDAITLKASDIHIEPQENEVIVRFRIDGVLDDAGVLPKQYYGNIINRIKIQAGLRIDEHTKSQDGAIRFRKEPYAADLRISIIPTLNGEKVVIRILGEYLRTLTLGELGLTPAYQKVLIDMAERPYGMILTVGPTGSGKTTTLYAILRILNEKGVNITTIEDPVEYRIPRINQVQVNEHSNLTFATGLRTIVRQDPDIILVGEIRDLETAETAVNASLTGHLLLTTFHSNDASTVIPRLLDMKVEPFMLASTLMVIIAQRLVRKICPNCKVSQVVTGSSIIEKNPRLAPYIKNKNITVYRGKGCAQCNFSGYKGQIGIFEFMTISPRIQDLILSNPSADQIMQVATEEGMVSFFEDGLAKVTEGITTYEELLRVALPPATR